MAEVTEVDPKKCEICGIKTLNGCSICNRRICSKHLKSVGFRYVCEDCRVSNQSSMPHPKGNCDDPTCPCSLMQPNQE